MTLAIRSLASRRSLYSTRRPPPFFFKLLLFFYITIVLNFIINFIIFFLNQSAVSKSVSLKIGRYGHCNVVGLQSAVSKSKVGSKSVSSRFPKFHTSCVCVCVNNETRLYKMWAASRRRRRRIFQWRRRRRRRRYVCIVAKNRPGL